MNEETATVERKRTVPKPNLIDRHRPMARSIERDA